jgi:NADH:ubiquinone oxidoreductase subunit 5 (subunit L)/multisubunit Na+/H+ antiporter MnhA subunit
MQLTPPTKNMFYMSVFLGLVGLILYLLGVFGVIEGGFQTIAHYAFWAAILGWLAMMIGVAAKGI